jgi:DNA-binding response OmpR family regulator/signal transduction histidine kinase
MRLKIFYLLVHLLFTIGGPLLYGGVDNPQNTGSRYLRNYSPGEYDTQPQNWFILQDKQGLIYSANQGGLLEYDGVSWRHRFIPNVVLRSLALDDRGNIYVGGVNEIGFFKPGQNNSLSYISLLDKLDKNQRNFSLVWRIHSTSEGIYFRTAKFLFRWNPAAKEMKIWQPLAKDSLFYGSFVCRDSVFIRHKDIGLMQMKEDSLQPVPGGELFAQMGIFAMFPYDDRRIVIGTRSDGLFLYDGKRIIPFPTEVDDYLREKKLSYGIRLSHSPGAFALATLGGGLVIMDAQGRIKELFTKASGLQDDNVKYVFEDFSGNLWLALNKGISKIEYASPISFYGEDANLPGMVLSVTRHGPHNHLYVGTTRGLYYLPFFGNPGGFQPVPGISGSCRSLLSRGDVLFAAADEGLFQLDPGNREPALRKVISNRTAVLLPSQREPRRIWVATSHGLFSLYQGNEGWTVERKFENINEEVTAMVEDEAGHLWVGTLGKGVLRIDFPSGTSPGTGWEPVVNRYNTSHDLPPGEARVFMAAGHMIVSTRQGVYRFDDQKQGFTPDYTFGKEFTEGSRYIFRLVEGKNKNIWFISHYKIYLAIPKVDGSFTLNSTPFSRLPSQQGNAIYLDPGGDVIWFARQDGLIRYDTTVKKDYRRDFRGLIRKVLNINTKSVIFDGHPPGDTSNQAGTGLPMPVFDYKDRNLRFEYAAPFFEDETRTEYGYLLEGYDDDWSAWTSETRKDYTNLDAGTYTFRVRAKNVYEHLGKEDVFRFKVLPPWYWTWWAYIIYALGAVLFFYLAVKWRHRKLVKEKRQLEQIVKDRTREIEEKNRQLEQQSEQLKELDEAKSRFFANISHEFRTPLTLIMGPLEQILAKDPEKDIKDKVHLMLRNSQRLLNLINQLLELARLDSGKMKLEASGQNIVPFLQRVFMCFESLGEQNNVDLIFINKEDDISVYFDEEKLEKVITNLLSNAFKYTPEQGSITVMVRKVTETEDFPSGCVEISVRDTGTGIPENQLSYIFDRFHRVEGSHEHKQKGSGIGLALTKELVELHHGKIEVQSSCRDDHSRGTEFLLRLPLGKEHLQPEEIVETDKPSARRAMKSFDQTFSKGGWHPQPIRPPAGPPEASKETEELEEEEKPLILVVDDNADVRMYIRGSLEPYFKVVEASNGKEGILRAKEIIPDLIVSDVMMPEADGFELCRTLKNDILTSHIPVILLTAKVSEESELEGLATGADDYITKPFSTSILAVRARNLIELRRQLQLERTNAMRLQPEEIPVSPIDDEFYQKLQDTVETHLSDPDFNAEALGRELQMSQATLWRKINALTGKTPLVFMRTYRLKRAAQLLGSRVVSVSEVADKVGFADRSYFSKCFKEQFNRLPSEFLPSGDIGGIGDETFPAADAAPLSETSKPMKEVILVVEDSDDARNYIRESLEPDYRVVEAADGSEGIARAMEIIPDLVVSDIMMPGTDGHELCRVLKADVRTSHIPIVLLTAKASEESKIKGLEIGADDYITKPFNANILRARIKNLIQLRSHLQKQRNREMTMLPAKISESEIDREFMKELNAVIRENLSDPEFNVEQLAKKLYMSSATVYRKVQALSGEIPSEYIRSFRLKRAAQLFKQNFGSITEVAFEVGFNSRAYFTKCFKEKFHQLPSVYMAVTSG